MNIGIFGYGNLGHGTELAVCESRDLHLAGIFTRRDPARIKPLTKAAKIFPAKDILSHMGEIDVLVICGGSATDLPKISPMLARHFNIVDSFDTHAAMETHFARVDAAARESGHLALVGAGWDPGLFSLVRLCAESILPKSTADTFWGPGVSQGHSDAIRRIPGVKDARQYTVPIEEAVSSARRCGHSVLPPQDKHRRECFVAAEKGADLARIENEIKTMPHYFANYSTSVHFVSEDTLRQAHGDIPHGGCVIAAGQTGLPNQHRQLMEFRLKLDSNPEFTGAVLAACARAVHTLHRRGQVGCITMADVAPADFSPLSRADFRRRLL